MKVPQFILPNGRSVFIHRLNITRTYAGHAEGTPESLTDYILADLAKLVKEVLEPAEPLFSIIPDESPLPNYMVVAELRSYESVRYQETDLGSFLYICWFVPSLETSINVMLSAILPSIKWEENAMNYDLFFS